jgi:hypothetical protein
MFSRKIRVEYEHDSKRMPCPLKWLDNFSMRNFTNSSIFDDTLPVADGVMEIGERVPLDKLKEAIEDWFRRKGYLSKEDEVVVGDLAACRTPV